MIETPSHAIAIPLSEEEADAKDGLLETGSQAGPTLVPSKPITAKIRSTVRHITAIGGFWARWRGFVPGMVYAVVASTGGAFFQALIPRVVPARELLGDLIAVVVFARFHMAWTHAVISLPSSIRWYQRLAPMKSIKQLWISNVVNHGALYAVVYLTMGLMKLMGVCNQAYMGEDLQNGKVSKKFMFGIFSLQGIIVILFAVAMVLCIVVPATVTLARVEASMLPDDQETIVPFDRSFDGKVVPQILGGTGAIGFLDAWRSFNWEARRRLIKLYVKMFMILVALTFLTFSVTMIEGWAIMGPETINRYAELVRAHQHY